MPDIDGTNETKQTKQYYTDVPQISKPFFLKGSNSLDWGMKNRLGKIFNP
ncbi:MAG: 3-hydroxy-5-phosphonooxypentane-2,4-dione thiolase LsrF, partial [Chitinispirillia bacterium]